MRELCFYHFTTAAAWEKIRHEGLRPHRPMADRFMRKGLPEQAYREASYGLTEPMIEQWKQYRRGKILRELFRFVARHDPDAKDLAVLKIDMSGEENVHAADYFPNLSLMTYDANGDRNKNKYFSIKLRYARSIIPLSEYSDELELTLPEVICHSHIPASRISLAGNIIIPGRK